MERNGPEWNGMERNGTKWNGMEQNDTEWSKMKWNETEWNRMKLKKTNWNLMKPNETDWNGMELLLHYLFFWFAVLKVVKTIAKDHDIVDNPNTTIKDDPNDIQVILDNQ